MTLNLTDSQVTAIIHKQIELAHLADIEYEMYFEKIGYAEFWKKFLPELNEIRSTD